MMTKCKLIALDIDGTLADSDGKITTRTKEVVHSVAQTGATIVVATGRRFITAKPRVLQLEFPEVLLAAHNGAILKRLNGELLHHQLLPCAVAKQVVQIAKELGLRPVVLKEHKIQPISMLRTTAIDLTVGNVDILRKCSPPEMG